MNKIETVLKQGLEEFEVKLKDMDAYCASHSIMPFLKKNETWLKSHQKDLLDAAVAEVRELRKEFVPADNIQIGGIESDVWKLVPKEDGMHCLNCERFIPEEGCLCGMATLQDIETLINNSTGV